MKNMIGVGGLAVVAMSLACASGSSSSGGTVTDAGAEAAAAGGGGGCATSFMGKVASCTEYLSAADIPKAKANCSGIANAAWTDPCPAGKTLGCKYAPGANTVPGGYILWGYSAGYKCNADATPVNP